MWTKADLKEKGRAAFTANYWKTVAASLVLLVLSGGMAAGTGYKLDLNQRFEFSGLKSVFALFNPMVWMLIAVFAISLLLIIAVITVAVNVFVINPFMVGIRRFFVQNLSEKAQLRELTYGFDHSYLNHVRILFFRGLYTFLWSLLLVVPGIVKSYEYRMIPYILADEPGISMEEAFRRSREMMNGSKWNTFVLDLSFIGWFILGAITFNLVNIFYAKPYYAQTCAALYEALKNKGRQAAAEQTSTEESQGTAGQQSNDAAGTQF